MRPSSRQHRRQPPLSRGYRPLDQTHRITVRTSHGTGIDQPGPPLPTRPTPPDRPRERTDPGPPKNPGLRPGPRHRSEIMGGAVGGDLLTARPMAARPAARAESRERVACTSNHWPGRDEPAPRGDHHPRQRMADCTSHRSARGSLTISGTNRHPRHDPIRLALEVSTSTVCRSVLTPPGPGGHPSVGGS